MRYALPLLAAVLAFAACKKEPAAQPEAPAQSESVPITRDPRAAASQISAAQRAAALAGQNNAKQDEAVQSVSE